MKNSLLFALTVALIFGTALDWPLILRILTILLACAALVQIGITLYKGKKD